MKTVSKGLKIIPYEGKNREQQEKEDKRVETEKH